MPLKELYNLYGFDNPFDTIQALMLMLTLSWQTTELLCFVIDWKYGMGVVLCRNYMHRNEYISKFNTKESYAKKLSLR